LRDLVKIRKHFTNLLLMIYIWVASSFNFYLINYITKNLPGDFFMNSLISSITDVIVAALSGIAYAKMGLRLVFSTFFAISAVGGVLIIVLGESLEGYVPMMLSFAKGGIKIAIHVKISDEGIHILHRPTPASLFSRKSGSLSSS
jgi:Na+/melibiose symporter-like transporter